MARSSTSNGLADRRELRLALSVDPGEAPRTRRVLQPMLKQWGFAAADVALLLVSELVTNALRHGRPPLELRVRLLDDALRVEVHDGAVDSRPIPEGEVPSWEDPSGRGMIIVDALASRWGWGPSSTGKHVWFEIDT